MRRAVITAYSPNYRRVAQLCLPSHKGFAARLGADFYALALPDDGEHNWRKVELISEFLGTNHQVLWLDADCIVPHDYELPVPIGQKYFFPKTTERGEPHYWHFAALYHNCHESFALLSRIIGLRPTFSCDGLADERALNFALREPGDRLAHAGLLLRGLIHYHGLPAWEKQLKLRADTVTY